MSSEVYRWRLVGDFEKKPNNHREAMFTPSTMIYVDKSLSRWYGIGGEWINSGLPM